ncbi:MAG: hypothetical protein MJE12_02225 [Alphaproteobacteria bacterium]|nr:hypothetical protein [Alphaproteobacteria bacterium]
MLRLIESQVKHWLSENDFPVPAGGAAATPEDAKRLAASMPNGAVVKALVPVGRRGVSGAIRIAETPDEAEHAAHSLLATAVNGYRVDEVYVEERIDIKEEFYLSLVTPSGWPEAVVSTRGGVDIEETVRNDPDAVTRQAIHPISGWPAWDAIDLWCKAGAPGPIRRKLGTLSSRLFRAFQSADALMLELNPLAIDNDGRPMLVGAMMGVDEHARRRHPEWAAAGFGATDRNEREERIARINREIPDGECQYIELDGDIGLLVGGGGAGLYQHDLVLQFGGAPANHCVTPPVGEDTRKLKAVIGAILDNPEVKAVLVGFNFAQMARADIRVRAVVEVLDEKGIDTARLPVVIRLFGAGEEEARDLVKGRHGIHYMPQDSSLKDAVAKVVTLAKGKR